METKRIYRKKIKSDDCRKTYTVRFNVGELYIQPPKNVKHWTMSVDERGGYWTRIIKEKNRDEAVYCTLKLFTTRHQRNSHNKKHHQVKEQMKGRTGFSLRIREEVLRQTQSHINKMI